MLNSTAFGVYAPLNASNLMLIVPLFLQPSVNMERKYGQFRRLGIIKSKFHEVRSWGHAESLGKGIPLELLVTDEEVIHSIELKMDGDTNPQEVLLGIVSVH
ncbi:hypothetical protein [Solilutibacter silvestris]|uniref:Uncharacterized protein n=1 Tax=Solilutibacter silvestris TaxID=1645665 RepID=A0A2K1Q223_9GAMM|nr:hypothetical protein [Lysobacter silvestris]PNS09100.1 hypothetical protein Lysil_0729 [Lysobacter silvestris]